MTISRSAIYRRVKRWMALGYPPEQARTLAATGTPRMVLGDDHRLSHEVRMRRAASLASGIPDWALSRRMREGKTLDEAVAIGKRKVGRPRQDDVTETWDPVVA